jgi:mRNA interferase HigB
MGMETLDMRIISRGTLREFWSHLNYRDAEQPLRAWFHEAQQAQWRSPHDIKRQFRHASFLSNNRVVFNIHGNKYRLVVAIKYEFAVLYIRFVGTHDDYDKIDARTI